MIVLLSLAWKSLRNRLLTTSLTVLSIGLSMALLLGVENVRVGARESFANTASREGSKVTSGLTSKQPECEARSSAIRSVSRTGS